MSILPKFGEAMKRILILGGAGQDGKFLGDILNSRPDVELTISTRKVLGQTSPNFVKNARYIQLDISNQEEMIAAVRTINPNVIVNLASISSVIECEKKPELSRLINEFSPIKIIELLEEKYKDQVLFIQASSSEMYSNSETRTINEESKTAPNNQYGWQKASVHNEIIQRQKNGERVASLVYFNHESILRSTSFVSRKIISSAVLISKGLQDKLVLGNLMSTRDWGYAGDYMYATSLVIDSNLPSNYVIGSGELHSILDFCKKAFECAGIFDLEPWLDVDPNLVRQNDSIGLVADTSKIGSDLGWKPTKNFDILIEDMFKLECDLIYKNEGIL